MGAGPGRPDLLTLRGARCLAEADLVVVDEIAKMEILSMPIREGLLQALDSDCPLLGTISLKGTGFLKQVKEREDVEIFKITPHNRDVLGQQVYRQLEKVLKQHKQLTPDS